ncbi:MAG: DUF4410 domain-containing protein, partial [Methylococcales bacterium]|nr:DUF4410 domain-containing protein [Methylococcales bacterium]
MKLSINFSVVFVALVTMTIVTGCASSDMTTKRSLANGPVSKPGRILVYDFVASADQIDDGSVISPYVQERVTLQTAKQRALGLKLGDLVAGYLVKDILALGMPAERANSLRPARVDDLILKGEFFSIVEGSRMKRMLIGFGAGANELKTHIMAYQLTPTDLYPLGDAEFKAEGGNMPGMAVPLIGAAAFGNVAVSAAISGGMNIAQESSPESLEGAAKRTADEITKELSRVFARKGWIPANKA